MIKNLTIGSDVEVFLQDSETKKNITAEGIIKGTKDRPFIVEEPFRVTSLDCVAAEYCINPVTSKEQWLQEHKFMLDYINTLAAERGLVIDSFPYREFEEDQLQTESAITFGCSSDFNMRLKCINESPVPDGGNRSIGLHLHLCWDDFELKDAYRLIYALDKFIALPMMLREPYNERRNLYGKASCFRFKAYGERQGIEYRTLSGWCVNDLEFVWDQLMLAFNWLENEMTKPFSMETAHIEDWELISNLIDNNNIEDVKNYLIQTEQ